jgi:signal peptidase I
MNMATWFAPALLLLCAAAWLADRCWLRRRTSPDPAGAAAVRAAAALFPPFAVVGLVLACMGRLYAVQSQSMVPTYRDADIVVASRWDLGFGIPGLPPLRPLRRGDVVVFRYPLDPSAVFVKRVIGLPGDEVSYEIEGGLRVNGQPVARQGLPDYWFYETGIRYPRYEEQLDGTRWQVINYTPGHRPSAMQPEPGHRDLDRCRYEGPRVSCRVPAGHLFAVGDNRDRSVDSRDWGFVPDGLLLGRVVARLGNWKQAGDRVAALFRATAAGSPP